MNRFINRALVVSLALASVVGVSGAFFTYAGQTQATQLKSSSLTMTLNGATPEIDNWLPGQVQELVYTLENSGTLPVQVKAYVAGSWADPMLEQSVVSIDRLEIWQDNTWQQISGAWPLEDEFLIVRQTGDTDPTTLEPGDGVQLRVSLRLSEDVTNEYQAELFNTELHVAGKQLDAGADWPDFY